VRASNHLDKITVVKWPAIYPDPDTPQDFENKPRHHKADYRTHENHGEHLSQIRRLDC
jgi:hypothetical protein